jgi:hypothetical protein
MHVEQTYMSDVDYDGPKAIWLGFSSLTENNGSNGSLGKAMEPRLDIASSLQQVLLSDMALTITV